MNYDFYGRVIALGTVESGQSARGEWRSQDVVFEHEVGQYPRHVVVRLWGDDLNRYQFVPNQFYHIVCGIDARETNGRWFNSIRLVSAEQIDQQTCYNNQFGNRMAQPQQSYQQGYPQQGYQQQQQVSGFAQQQGYGQPQQMGNFGQPQMGGFNQPQMGGMAQQMPQQMPQHQYAQPQQPQFIPPQQPVSAPFNNDFVPPVGTVTNPPVSSSESADEDTQVPF